jgi:hypothetical protein
MPTLTPRCVKHSRLHDRRYEQIYVSDLSRLACREH